MQGYKTTKKKTVWLEFLIWWYANGVQFLTILIWWYASTKKLRIPLLEIREYINYHTFKIQIVSI